MARPWEADRSRSPRSISEGRLTDIAKPIRLILTTAGGLVFTNESGRLVVLDAATGKMLWHVNPGGNLSGAPMTYELDGHQFVLTPVGGWLYAWALPAGR